MLREGSCGRMEVRAIDLDSTGYLSPRLASRPQLGRETGIDRVDLRGYPGPYV
jgi:hypothetical protein